MNTNTTINVAITKTLLRLAMSGECRKNSTIDFKEDRDSEATE